MRIGVVVPEAVPPTWGGAERAWTGLQRAIDEHTDHRGELVSVPVREHTLPDLVDAYRTFAHLDVSRFDLVITSKYPAWMAAHPNHVLWMFHRLRGLYDTYRSFALPTHAVPVAPELRPLHGLLLGPSGRHLLDEAFAHWDTALAALGPGHPELAFPGPLARRLVHWLDGTALAPGAIARYCALSATVAGRPGYFPPGIAPRVVYAPADLTAPADPIAPPAPAELAAGGSTPYLFTVSRLDGPKRLELLVAAMAEVPGQVELRIAGTGPAEAELRRLAAADPRIRFLGFVADDDLPGLYAGALAVPFVPAEEDFGLVALEAFACATPVVTCRDSGGPAELVVDGLTGLVTRPDPVALGDALASLVADPERARAMGRSARRWGRRIAWPATVAALLDPDPDRARGVPPAVTAGRRPNRARPDRARLARPARSPRPKVVVTATYRVFPPFHGGQLRCWHLFGRLAERADVEIVSLVGHDDVAGRSQPAPGLAQTTVPMGRPQHDRIAELSAKAGLPLTDILAGRLIEHSSAYLEALGRAARRADGVLLAQPYLLGATRHLDLPKVYDAQNAEYVLKAAVLGSDPLGARLLRLVRDIEEEALVASRLVVACSEEDRAGMGAEYGIAPERIEVVPNGTDTTVVFTSGAERSRLRDRWLDHFSPGTEAGTRRPRRLALFLASWHLPNIDATEAILEAARMLPDVVFLIGGSVGAAFAGRQHPANVVFMGTISNRAKRVLLDCADVALNPMRVGSGTNLKVLEYLAAGVPVVSTAFGIRGLDGLGPDQVLVTGPGAEHLAAALSATLADPAGAEERARAGRRVVDEAYGWDSLGRRFGDLVLSALDSSPPCRATAVAVGEEGRR